LGTDSSRFWRYFRCIYSAAIANRARYAAEHTDADYPERICRIKVKFGTRPNQYPSDKAPRDYIRFPPNWAAGLCRADIGRSERMAATTRLDEPLTFNRNDSGFIP
jgi:hypothetical protein